MLPLKGVLVNVVVVPDVKGWICEHQLQRLTGQLAHARHAITLMDCIEDRIGNQPRGFAAGFVAGLTAGFIAKFDNSGHWVPRCNSLIRLDSTRSYPMFVLVQSSSTASG